MLLSYGLSQSWLMGIFEAYRMSKMKFWFIFNETLNFRLHIGRTPKSVRRLFSEMHACRMYSYVSWSLRSNTLYLVTYDNKNHTYFSHNPLHQWDPFRKYLPRDNIFFISLKTLCKPCCCVSCGFWHTSYEMTDGCSFGKILSEKQRHYFLVFSV